MKRAIAQERGGSIRKQVVDPVTGRRLSISGESLDEVLARAERIRRLGRELRAGEIPAADARTAVVRTAFHRMSMADLWRRYEPSVSEASRPIARSDWSQRIEPHLGTKSIHEMTADVVRGWMRTLEESGYAHATILNSWARVQAMFSFALEAGFIGSRPWGAFVARRVGGRARVERPACRSAGEAAALVRAALLRDEQMRSRGRYADLCGRVLVALMCGLRQGELGALGWDDLFLEGANPRLVVRHQVKMGWRDRHPEWDRPRDLPKWMGAGEQSKEVPIPYQVVAYLRFHRAHLERLGWYAPDGPVFPAVPQGGWRTYPRTIDPEDMKVLAAEAGLPNPEGWSPHSLKASFTTLSVILSRGDLRRVQALTRHKDLKVLTEHYLRMVGSQSRPVFASVDVAELPGEVVEVDGQPVGIDAPDDLGELTSQMAVDLAPVTLDPARAVAEMEARRAAARAALRRDIKRRVRGSVAMAELAADHVRAVDAGERKASERPEEITVAMQRAYDARYQREVREHGDKRRAQAAGKRSRKAVIMRWAQAVRAAQNAQEVARLQNGAGSSSMNRSE